MPAVQILGRHAIGRVALHVDALDAAPIDEIVDVGRTPGGAERLVDVGKLHAQRSGLGLVDLDVELWRVVQAVGANAHQHRVLRRHAQKLVAGCDHPVMTDIAAILHLDVEAGGVAQFLHRGRHQRVDLRVADTEEVHVGAVGDGGGAVFGPFTQAPVAQAGKRHTGILARTGEGEAGHREDELDVILFLVEIMLGHGLRHLQRLGLSAAGRQGDQVEDEALVLVGQEACGQAHEQKRHHRHDHGIARHSQPRAAHDARQPVAIPVAEAVEAIVEPAEPLLGMGLVFFLDRPQQRGAERR